MVLGSFGKRSQSRFTIMCVMCISAHFPPPGIEDDFEFVGFHYMLISNAPGKLQSVNYVKFLLVVNLLRLSCNQL